MRTHKRWLTVGAVLLALLLVSAIPVAADPGIIYVDGTLGNDTGTCGIGTGAYACETIGRALELAAAGDTIQVAAGTYAEDLVINNKANLTIKSATGAATTVIQGVTDITIALNGTSHNFTLGGAAGKGFKVVGNAANSTFLFQITNGASGVTVSYNDFRTTGKASHAISVGAAGAANLTVSHNTFTLDAVPDDDDVAVALHGPMTDLLVDNNVVDGSVPTYGSAVFFTGDASTDGAVISNNTFTEAWVELRLGGDTKHLRDITISDNIFDDGVGGEGAIFITEDVEGALERLSDLTITGNTFRPGAGPSPNTYALEINGEVEDTDLDYDTIHFNNNSVVYTLGTLPIVNNHPNDAGAAGIPDLDAECNWWGDVDGPAVDQVSDDVDYDPWVTLALSAVDGKAEANGSDAEEITASLVCGASAAPAGHPLDFTKVDFQTDLGFFTLTLLQDTERNVPLVDGEAAVKLYSQWVGRAKVDVSPAGAADWVEEENLVTFYPEKPFISYPPHRSTISERRPLFLWTASPATEEVRLFYRLRLVKARPLPRELVFKARTDLTSYRSPRLAGKVYVLRVRACAKFFDPTVTVCSRFARSRFRIVK